MNTQFSSENEQLRDALSMAIDNINSLVSSKPVRNLDENLLYFDSLVNRKLPNLLKLMDIPESRLDISKEENLRWLVRNLAIRNGNHPDFEATMQLIKDELIKLK